MDLSELTKVVAVLPNYFGGGKRITDTIVSALNKSGFEFTLVTDHRYVDSAGSDYRQVLGLDLVGAHFSADVTACIADVIRPTGADVLWLIGDEYPCIDMLRSAIAENGRIIYHLHSRPFYQVGMRTGSLVKKMRERLFHSYSRRYFRRTSETLSDVDNYVTLCNGYTDRLRHLYPAYADKVRTVYNPAPPINLNCLPAVEKLKEIVYVGRLSRADKRVDNLLRIFAMVQPSHPDWNLRIIGDGDERHNLEQLADSLGLANIEFVGQQSNPDMSSSAIVALTSAIEGWPTALVEGMQAGAAPIAFNCSAGVEELLSGGRGILVTPGDLQEYAARLSELMDSETLRQQICATHRSFLEKLSLTRIANQWRDIFTYKDYEIRPKN